MKGLLLTANEHEMLEQEREMARERQPSSVLKTSCILLVSDGRFQKDVADMLAVPIQSLNGGSNNIAPLGWPL